MKRHLFILLFAVFSVQFCFAQNNLFTGKSVMFQSTIGVPIETYGLKIPPIGISAEYGVYDFGRAGALGAGALFDYSAHGPGKYYEDSEPNWNPHWIETALFVGYHFFITPGLEVHAKTGVGYYSFREKYPYWTLHDSGTTVIQLVGISYYFTDHLGVTLETGYDRMSYVRAGVVLLF